MGILKKTTLKGLLFAALITTTLIAGPGAAQAYEATFSGQFSGDPGSDLTTLLGSISLNQFNSSLGTLNSVTIDLTSDFNYLTTLQNNQTTKNSTGIFIIDQQLQIKTLGQTMLDTGPYTYQTTLYVAPGATGINNATNVNPTSNILTISGSALAAYIGSGNLMFNVYSSADLSESISGGNFNANVGTTFDTTATITYDYTPVPIPAAFMLFGTGLLGLLGIRRKKLFPPYELV